MPEFPEELEYIDEVSGQAVQAADDDAVCLAAAHLFGEALESRSVEGGAGVSFVVETLLDPPPYQPLPGPEVIAADLEQGLELGESATDIDGLAGVDGAAGYRQGALFQGIQFHGFGLLRDQACSQAAGESYP